MRLSVLLLFAPLAWLGCTRENAAPGSQDSGVLPIVEDGSMVACTSIGGTCMPYSDASCPPERQDPTLCENVILLCCLPTGTLEDGGPAVTYDATIPTNDASMNDASMTYDANSALDATLPVDASVLDQEAPPPTMDASADMDDAGD